MKKELLDKETQYMLKNDLIEESQIKWRVPMHLGRKTKVKTKVLIPRIADCIDQIGNTKFVSTFDMQKGCWQVPLKE